MAEERGSTPISVEEILDAARPGLLRVLARFRIPLEDADDLIQEVLLQFVRKRAEIETPRTWLSGALRNECLLYWRQRRRRLYVAVDEAVLDAVAGQSGPQQEHEALMHRLEELISGLKERCREVLRLRYVLGCKPGEIAERTGYKLSSVDKIVRRCVAALSQRMLAAGLGRN